MSEPAPLSAPFFKKSRNSSVKPPRPIDVKKLMAKRVFLGLSFGKMPSKKTCIVSSWSRSFSFGRPMY